MREVVDGMRFGSGCLQCVQDSEVRAAAGTAGYAVHRKGETWAKMRKRYIACDLLIVDDWLLETISPSQTRKFWR